MMYRHLRKSPVVMESSKGRCPPFVKQGFVTAAVCTCILGHGCILGFPAVLLPQLLAPDSVIPVDQASASWLASMMMIPVLIGNFLMPSVMDRLGRRTALILVILPALVGWFITVMAQSFLALTIGRILQGLSFGLNLPLRSALIGEYVSPKYRGSFLMVVALATATGIFTVHLIGSFLSWQRTGLICLIFPYISLVMTLYIPESPSYLAAKGRFDECRRVFRWLRGDEEDEELEDMISAHAIADAEDKGGGFVEFVKTLKKKEFYKPVLIMVHIYGSVQFAGAAIMAVYTPFIITSVAGSEVNVYFWMIFLDVQRILSNSMAVYVITKFKRRTMLFLIGGLCIISQLALAVYVFCKRRGMLYYDAVWIPILLINFQVFTVATGMLPLPNVLAGEVFPFQYRGFGGSISVVTATAWSFILLKTFIGLAESIGIDGIYASFSVVMMYFLTVVWFILPETKGKTLQQIEDEYKGSPVNYEEVKALRPIPSRAEIAYNRKMSVISKHSIVVDI